ncbi:hypothetical protein KFK09_011579 [Dendrobium nobile]|uniref:Uncharacterized protein n=1 Tax=Dendrobium nobile TaxID=94219 RepID=A0A8T3BEX7_DENNO|nr:hypothetical protein KFK09_011579 [Dendrobium nobile]
MQAKGPTTIPKKRGPLAALIRTNGSAKIKRIKVSTEADAKFYARQGRTGQEFGREHFYLSQIDKSFCSPPPTSVALENRMILAGSRPKFRSGFRSRKAEQKFHLA